MEMSQSFNAFRMTLLESPQLPRSRGVAVYIHPDDVISDPDLTLAEKRAILASWISDARAVENAPSLRRLDSGAVVEVDAIQQALVLLDELAPEHRSPCKGQAPLGRRRSVMSSLLKRLGSPLRSNDHDDDPPPAPAGFGIPFRPKPLSPAHGACLERALDLACATGE
jgi:hypothetical protein